MRGRVFGIVCATLTILLAGCGGGSGGGGVVASTADFPLGAISQSVISGTTSAAFTLSGSIDGLSVVGSGTMTAGAPIASPFEEDSSALAKTSTITGTLTRRGENSRAIAEASVAYYSDSYRYLGEESLYYIVARSPGQFPVSARVSDTGEFYRAEVYGDSTKSELLGTIVATWVLEPDTASTALWKLILVFRDTSGSISSTSVTTSRIRPEGTSRVVSIVVTTSGQTLIYTF
jgi:hypothetical protein